MVQDIWKFKNLVRTWAMTKVSIALNVEILDPKQKQ